MPFLLLEDVYRKANGMIKGLAVWPYKASLKELEMFSVKERRQGSHDGGHVERRLDFFYLTLESKVRNNERNPINNG